MALRDVRWEDPVEGIVFGAIDKVMQDQDAKSVPARTKPLHTWSDYLRIVGVLVGLGVEIGMPKYVKYAGPVVAASSAFLTQSVWRWANSEQTTKRVNYQPVQTGAGRRVAMPPPGGGAGQQIVTNGELLT